MKALKKIIKLEDIMSLNFKGMELGPDEGFDAKLLQLECTHGRYQNLFKQIDAWNTKQLLELKREIEDLKSESDSLFEENVQYYEESGELEY